MSKKQDRVEKISELVEEKGAILSSDVENLLDFDITHESFRSYIKELERNSDEYDDIMTCRLPGKRSYKLSDLNENSEGKSSFDEHENWSGRKFSMRELFDDMEGKEILYEDELELGKVLEEKLSLPRDITKKGVFIRNLREVLPEKTFKYIHKKTLSSYKWREIDINE